MNDSFISLVIARETTRLSELFSVIGIYHFQTFLQITYIASQNSECCRDTCFERFEWIKFARLYAIRQSRIRLWRESCHRPNAENEKCESTRNQKRKTLFMMM